MFYIVWAYFSSHNVDIDECQTNYGGCVQKCINTDGSYECSCNDGFEMTSDGLTCAGKCIHIYIIIYSLSPESLDIDFV